ncbi:MAG: D-sedoheptulose 7-phosphate isomerase [Candidatus Omnitrophica bacterium]|nr:D-sedoheptulose 7-phosphate isomerase [Candidatus Omnitrophota bacterium]MCM8829974.1 D-sedoheptulose 7-phosphate isomerase [Candidatus Omnitrophota bacterium]
MTKKKQDEKDIIKESISESISTKEKLLKPHAIERFILVSSVVVDALKNGNKVLLCGNGGSAADCQHWAAEMTGRFLKERRSLPFIALTTNSSELTSIGNDYSFNVVFSRQVEGIGKKGDILICISTSGASKNVIEAAKAAKKKKMKVISLTGKEPSHLSKISDITISVNSTKTPRIQEAHSLIIHILCHLIEEKLF